MEPDAPLPYISRLRVQNFRSIADLDLPLGPLTVLVGPNGSGKSNIVDALRFMRDALSRGLDQAVRDRNGLSGVFRRVANGYCSPLSIDITLELERGIVNYGFSLTDRDRGRYEVSRQSLEVTLRSGQNYSSNIDDKPVDETRKLLAAIRQSEKSSSPSLLSFDRFSIEWLISGGFPTEEAEDFSDSRSIPSWGTAAVIADEAESTLSSLTFYSLFGSNLDSPQKLVRGAPLDERGENMVAVLRAIRRDKSGYLDLKLALSQLVEGVSDLSTVTSGGFLSARLHYPESDGGLRKSDLLHESEGTVRMLGILAALYQDPAPPLLALEEPEANIHPGALGVLAGVLKQASTRGQVLVTTHSPDLLDHLPPESFVVVEKVDGETKAGPLRREQAKAVRRNLFSPGELLRMEGLDREAPL